MTPLRRESERPATLTARTRPALLRSVLIAIGIAVSLVAILILFAWWAQERIVFQPAGPPFPAHGDTRRVDFTAEDGQELFAFVVEPPQLEQEQRRVLIAFHGNADLAVLQIPWAEEVARRTGWTVLLPEYRGYGGAPGVPTITGVRLDARAALRIATDSLGASTLAYFGHSLGSAVAAELAAEHPPSRLILQSPFTSARDMARVVVARPVEMAWRMISRVHYDTRSLVRELAAPVWVVHGENDLIIPSRMGREVYDEAQVKGELLIVRRAGHNDLEMRGGEEYWQWLEEALR